MRKLGLDTLSVAGRPGRIEPQKSVWWNFSQTKRFLDISFPTV